MQEVIVTLLVVDRSFSSEHSGSKSGFVVDPRKLEVHVVDTGVHELRNGRKRLDRIVREHRETRSEIVLVLFEHFIKTLFDHAMLLGRSVRIKQRKYLGFDCFSRSERTNDFER